jgi:TonB family protein
MSIHRVIVASAASLASLGVLMAAPAWPSEGGGTRPAGHCEARIVSAQTEFPKYAQDRGDGGTVRVKVVLDSNGNVTQSSVTSSSGSRTLDKAAEKSVSTDWRFDVSHCIASALPAQHEVNVVYRRVPKSFSASVDRRGLEYAKQAATNTQCSVVPADGNVHVISCIERATPGGIAASGLATR